MSGIKRFHRTVIWLLLLSVLFALTGCGKKPDQRPQLHADFPGREIKFSFAPQASQTVALSEASARSLLQTVGELQVEYPYAQFYELEEVKARLDLAVQVESHQHSALDGAGRLTADSLYQKVLANNKAFLEGKPFGYTEVEADYIAELCRFIVQVVNIMLEKYPDIDRQRVYCNLGNLKILYNTGMLSYAQVSGELVLSISKNNTTIVLNMKGEDGFSRVLTHEIMHILQIGCVCENIENCGRRAGIAVYWDDFTLNTTDWTWMVEGAAERNMCNLTGGEAVSYQYKMDYLCSMTMSVLLRDTVKADTMETLCFYSDPELLFDAFACENQAQRDELLKLMITMQVLQMQPKSFYIMYKEKTGIDLQEDEEARNQFSYALKPAVCISLAKEFYENLIPFLQQNQVSCNDLFFLIDLFEGHLNQHLTFTNESKAEINRPFISSYTQLRGAFFAALEADNPGMDISALYAQYAISNGEGLLNAQLAMLPQEKREFLAERAQWQAELNGLGKKVPLT